MTCFAPVSHWIGRRQIDYHKYAENPVREALYLPYF